MPPAPFKAQKYSGLPVAEDAKRRLQGGVLGCCGLKSPSNIVVPKKVSNLVSNPGTSHLYTTNISNLQCCGLQTRGAQSHTPEGEGITNPHTPQGLRPLGLAERPKPTQNGPKPRLAKVSNLHCCLVKKLFGVNGFWCKGCLV